MTNIIGKAADLFLDNRHKSPPPPSVMRFCTPASYLLLQMPPDYLRLRVTLRPQGSIRLYGRRELPLMEARIIASATVEKREDTSMVSCTRGHQREGFKKSELIVAWHFLGYRFASALARSAPSPV